MRLTEEQIQTLLQFTEKKLVRYYDLQIELVDHLASEIEEKMEVNKNLSFEQALSQVYEGFGVFGFSNIVREKEKQLVRTYNKMLWKAIKSLFYWPHIAGMFTLFAFLYTLSYSVELIYLRVLLGITALIFVIYDLILLWKKQKFKKNLLIMSFYKPGLGPAVNYFYIQYLIFYTGYGAMAFTISNFIVITLLLAGHQVNRKIKASAMEQFPEAFA